MNVKKNIQRIFNFFGLEVIKKRKFNSANSYLYADLIKALDNSKKRRVMPESIIDVGAAAGEWTMAAMNVWDKSQYVLFEPLEERKKELKILEAKYNNLHFINCGAGSKTRLVDFYVSDDLDGSGVAEHGERSNLRKVEVRSIDAEVQRLKLKGPFLIKLDTHGYEIPILEGAKETLTNTSLVIIECYIFHVAHGSLLLWEMCKYMDELGFRMVDMVDLMWRKKDKAFWQCDVFFIPKDDPCFNSNSFE